MKLPDVSMDDFKRDREEALLSLDPAKLRAYAAKYGAECPQDDETLIISAHKAITVCRDLPMDRRRASKAWLNQRRFESLDDGDVTQLETT